MENASILTIIFPQNHESAIRNSFADPSLAPGYNAIKWVNSPLPENAIYERPLRNDGEEYKI